MPRFWPGLTGVFAILVVLVAAPALAQESLDSGKTPAQLFASDCALCHKSPQGVARAGGMSGLDGFLRQHYTASRESAGAIAAYLQAIGNAPAPATKRNAKGGDRAKAAEKKGAKPGDAKPGEVKPGAAKPGEAKAGEAKAAEPKPGESKPSEPTAGTPSEAKPPETKPPEAKPSEPKPAEGSNPDKSN
jgi:hypothetical protein